MNTFAVLLLCAQACLVQNVFGQCLRGADIIAPACGYAGAYGLDGFGGYGLNGFAGAYGLDGIGAYGLNGFAGAYGLDGIGAYGLNGFAGAYGLNGVAGAYGLGLASPLAYGGEGVGDVAVIGELPVAGTTLVAGQVPILGAVEFGGIVPAAGGVSIAGSCGCGCRGPYLY